MSTQRRADDEAETGHRVESAEDLSVLGLRRAIGQVTAALLLRALEHTCDNKEYVHHYITMRITLMKTFQFIIKLLAKVMPPTFK